MKVVLTGGPGVGKTSITKKLIELNYQVMPEVFTEIFEKAKAEGRFDSNFRNHPELLHDLVQRQHELELQSFANDQSIIFFDRSMVDIIRFAKNQEKDFSEADKKIAFNADYDFVFFVEPLPENYYDNSAIRGHSYEESLDQHEKMRNEYQDYFRRQGKDPNQVIISVKTFLEKPFDPKKSIEIRTKFILETIESMLTLPSF